jgi:hypothetical protein
VAVNPALKWANALLTCLETQFAGVSGRPENFCLRAGEQISEDIDPIVNKDLCCEGLGWVRIGGKYPSSNFPEPDGALKRNGCLPTGWAQELEIGVLRCYLPNSMPEMASCAQHTVAAEYAADDAARIECAIACWEKLLPKGRLFQVVGIVPVGPHGNCIQTVGTLQLAVPKCC